MKIRTAVTKFIVCVSLFAAGAAFGQLTTNYWTGGGSPNNRLDVSGNWSLNAAPANGNWCVWSNSLATATNYLYSATIGGGSGNSGASYEIQGAYTNPMVIYTAAGSVFSMSNLVVDAGAGPFTFGSNGFTSEIVFRAGGSAATATNLFINNSANVATIAPSVTFGDGGGQTRAVVFGGSGAWLMNTPWNSVSSANQNLVVSGTGANTLTMTADAGTAGITSDYIVGGTLILADGNALAVSGSQTLFIGGGGGQITLALSNNITLNPAIATIDITGRTTASGAADAAIANFGGNNAINSKVVFNVVGGTNVEIYTPTGTLTFNGGLTCANVTGVRNFTFTGAGTSIIDGVISNGSATAGIVLSTGTLVLNNANTYTGNTIISSGVLTVGNNNALSASSASVGGTLDLNGGNGFSPYIGGLSGAGTVDSLSGGTPVLSVGSNDVSSVFGGDITNSQAGSSVSLQKIGTGTFTLGGASGYSGGTTVAQGTLLAGNTAGSATGTGNVVVNLGAAFGGSGNVQGNVNWQSGSSAQFALSPVAGISGSNSTPLVVAGNLTLSGNGMTVNVAGATPLGAGTYTLMTYNNSGSSGSFNSGTPTFTGAGVALGTSAGVSTSGGAVTLTVNLTGVTATWTNNASGSWASGANWSSNPQYPQHPGDAATLGVGLASAYTTVTLNGNESVGTLIFTNANSFLVADAGNTLTIDNKTNGAASISVLAGSSNAISAAVVLNTNVSVSLSAGTALSLTNVISNGSGVETLGVGGSGTMALSGQNTYGPAAGSVGTTMGGGVLILGNNSAIGAGDLSVSGSSTIQAGLALSLANNIIAGPGATVTANDGGNSMTLSGMISGAGALVKNGPGTVTLGNTNNYNGSTIINGGNVVLNNAGGIPGGAGFGDLTLGTNVTLNLNGNSVVLDALNATASTATIDTLSGTVENLVLGENGDSGTFAGSISNTVGTITLIKDGAGTQTLSGTNVYTGGTTINAGTLQVGNGGTSGTLGFGTLLDDGNLQYNLVGSDNITYQINGTGSVTLNNSALVLNLDNVNNGFTGGINVNSGWLWINQLTGLGGSPQTVTSISPTAQIHLDGSLGNVTLGSSISFNLSGSTGVLINNSGNNEIDGNIGMPNGAGNPYIIVTNGSLTLGGTISTVTGNNNRTLTLGGAGNGVITGTIIDSGLPTVSVLKQDAGTWDLTGTGLYAGTTTVNGGTLLVDGTLEFTGSGLGTLTVSSNAAFGGMGQLYTESVTWNSGTTGAFTAAASGPTPLTVYGNVTLTNNPITINVAGGTPLTAGSYTLLANGNTAIYTITGGFATTPTITGAGVAPGTVYSVVSSSSSVVLVVSQGSTWTSPVNGSWTTGANWSSNPNFPGSAGQFATLGFGSSMITINLNASESVGGITFTNNNSFAITNVNNVLTLDNSGLGAIIGVTAGASNSISAGVYLNDSTTVSGSAGTALLIPGPIAGVDGLTLAGGGLLSLSGANTYSGNTVLSGGTLVLGSTNAVGAGTFTINSGSLDSSVPNLVNLNNNAQNWNGAFTFLGSQNLNLGNGSVALASGGAILTLNSNQLTVAGSISGSGTLTINGTNGTTLELDGANSFTGAVQFNGGTLSVGSDSAVGTSTLNINSATCIIQAVGSSTHTITNTLGMTGNGIYTGGNGDLVFAGAPTSYNFSKVYDITNPVTTLSFNLPANPGGSTKNGPGTLVMSGSNVNSGGVTVNLGILALGSTNALGTGTLVMNGGGLDSTVANLSNLNNNAQTWGGSFVFAGSQSLNLGTGSVTMSANTTITVTNNTLTIGGPVGGSGALTKAGAGNLTLAGADTYTNNTTVNGGTLELAQAVLGNNSTASIASGAVLKLDFAVTNTVGALVLNGVTKSVGVYGSSTPGGYIAGTGYLQVVQTGPSGPAQITNSISGGTLTLTWPAGQGWVLLSQTNSLSVGLNPSAAAWLPVPGSPNGSYGVILDPTKPAVFYKLQYPYP